MRIGVIGAGNMAAALGRLWAAAGHQVMFSHSRDPEKLRRVAEEAGNGATTGSAADATAFGEVVVLAVGAAGIEEALRAAGAPEGSLDGKVLVDITNWLHGPIPTGFASGAEFVAGLAPGVRVVKAFNTIFAPLLQTDPGMVGGQRATGLYAGDDDAAKEMVVPLIEAAGFEPFDAGLLSSAHHLEQAAQLVIHLGYGMGRGPTVALKVLRR
jgi:8-hydroxy-5-deazaflavin:NADPH oxidoreductase